MFWSKFQVHEVISNNRIGNRRFFPLTVTELIYYFMNIHLPGLSLPIHCRAPFYDVESMSLGHLSILTSFRMSREKTTETWCHLLFLGITLIFQAQELFLSRQKQARSRRDPAAHKNLRPFSYLTTSTWHWQSQAYTFWLRRLCILSADSCSGY